MACVQDNRYKKQITMHTFFFRIAGSTRVHENTCIVPVTCVSYCIESDDKLQEVTAVEPLFYNKGSHSLVHVNPLNARNNISRLETLFF